MDRLWIGDHEEFDRRFPALRAGTTQLGRRFVDILGLEQLSQIPRYASDLIIPRSRRLFFAGVRETSNSNRLLASPDIAQTPTAPVASARF